MLSLRIELCHAERRKAIRGCVQFWGLFAMVNERHRGPGHNVLFLRRHEGQCERQRKAGEQQVGGEGCHGSSGGVMSSLLSLSLSLSSHDAVVYAQNGTRKTDNDAEARGQVSSREREKKESSPPAELPLTSITSLTPFPQPTFCPRPSTLQSQLQPPPRPQSTPKQLLGCQSSAAPLDQAHQCHSVQ